MVSNLRRPLVPAFALILTLWTGSTAGADDWPVARGPSCEPVPYLFDCAALARIPRAFLDDSAACILYFGSSHLLEADGTVETITHEITRLNGRKGIESLGEYRHITFDPAAQKLVLNEARIIKADGRIVPIEPRHVQVRDADTDYQVYDRDKQLVISFPNLEVGDIYEVKWTTRGKNAEFFGKFFMRTFLGDDSYPTVRDEMRVRLPRSMPFHFATINGDVKPAIRDQGKYRLYHWAVSDRPSLAQDGDRPSKEDLRLEVVCSTFASWDEVGQWKHKLRAACWECTPEIRTRVEDITRNLKTPLEKARALTYWVRRHVRYISISSSGHGYTPRLPAQVFASRYGDCKDQTQLLAVMLKEAGLDVALVTLGALDDGQVVPEVPSPWGTHAILLVRNEGRDHWIDTTATRAGWDFLPRSDRDRAAYVTSAGKVRLLRTPPMTPADNRVEQTTQVLIQPDGSSLCRRTMTYHGRAAVSRRHAWIEVPPGERRRHMTAELQDAHSRTRLLALDVDESKLSDLDQPVAAHMEYAIRKHFSGAPVLEGSITDSPVWSGIIAYNLDPDRTLPLHLGTPFESIHRYKIQLPYAYRLESLPTDQEVRSRWGWLRVKVEHDAREPRRLEVVFQCRLNEVLVPPSEFAAYQKFHEDVYKTFRVWLTLKPTDDLADAPALELLHLMAPDRKSTGVLARLYHQQGMKEDAYRVIRRGLFYFPDDGNLWELAVQSAPGLEEKEILQRLMVRRFADKPAYAIALGATLVKRGNLADARKVLFALTGNIAPDVSGAAHYHLAQCAFQQKQYAAALQHLEVVLKLRPERVSLADVYRLRAQVHEQQGKRDQAIAAYREALKEQSEAEDVLAALVRLELAGNHPREALSFLRRYTVLAGSDVERLNTAAELYLRMKRLDDALDLAQQARDIRFHAGTQRILGLIHLQRHEFAKALDHFERADPDAQVLEGRIRAYLALGKLHEAERLIEQVGNLAEPTLELRQAHVATLGLLLRRATLAKDIRVDAARSAALLKALDALVCAEYALEEQRPAPEVEALLAGAFNGEVEVGPAYALRGLLALRKGHLLKALADADRALVLGPREARTMLVRGRVRYERADPGALADLKEAAALSQRKDGTILHWLAAALFQAGRRGEALSVQRQALALRPGDAEIRQQLAEFERAAK